MDWTKILILTFKPAVQNAWEKDLANHLDFDGWQFVSKKSLDVKEPDTDKLIVCFDSFQDYLGKNKAGGIKAKNEWVHTTNWDCVAFGEYHYGAWDEGAKELFEAENLNEIGEGLDFFDEANMTTTTPAYLYLSGTPFQAISSWTGMLMLLNVTSPETYFQAAFRVQTPWMLLSG